VDFEWDEEIEAPKRNTAMKTVNDEDVPALTDELLQEIESTGVTILILKQGRPFVRLTPPDETPISPQ